MTSIDTSNNDITNENQHQHNITLYASVYNLLIRLDTSNEESSEIDSRPDGKDGTRRNWTAGRDGGGTTQDRYFPSRQFKFFSIIHSYSQIAIPFD